MTHEEGHSEETQKKETQKKETQKKAGAEETRRGLGAENTHVRDASAINDETGTATVPVFSGSGTLAKVSEEDDDGNTHVVLSDNLAVGEKIVTNASNTVEEEES